MHARLAKINCSVWIFISCFPEFKTNVWLRRRKWSVQTYEWRVSSKSWLGTGPEVRPRSWKGGPPLVWLLSAKNLSACARSIQQWGYFRNTGSCLHSAWSCIMSARSSATVNASEPSKFQQFLSFFREPQGMALKDIEICCAAQRGGCCWRCRAAAQLKCFFT